MRASGGSLDRQAADRTLSTVAKRVFLLHDVHAGAPITFMSRWALSYLRGPLSKEQIRTLTSQVPPSERSGDGGISPKHPQASPGAKAGAKADGRTGTPVLPPDIPQYFVPAQPGAHYHPVALGVARVTYADPKLKINETRDVVAAAPITDAAVPVDWTDAEILDVAAGGLGTSPVEGATFDPVPKAAALKKNYAAWQKAFASWVTSSQTLDLHRHAGLKMTSAAAESERDFRIRVQGAQREARDEAVEAVRRKFAEKRARLEEKARRAEQGVQREQEQASQAKLQTAVSVGATIFGALLGRKAISTSTLGRATTAARGVGRASKEQDDVKRAQENVDVAKQGLEELDAQIAEETAAIAARFDADASAVEKTSLAPKRGGVLVQFVALGWRP